MKDVLADLYLASLHLLDLVWLYARNSNAELGYYNLLFSIAMAANPTTILELGTGAGLSSRAFIRAIQYYRRLGLNRGVLYTCDNDQRAIQRLRRFVRFGDIVIPFPMSSNELADLWCKQPRHIDLLYIDAYHSHEQSLVDFEHFSPYVAPNGLVLLHDTFPIREAHEQLQYSGTVWKTAQYIKQHYRDEFEIMTLPYLSGISLLRRRGAKYY